MYRRDRKKGGGGVMAFVSSSIPSRRVVLPKKFLTIEPLAVEAKFGQHDAITIGIYRPPKPSGESYYLRLVEELNEICTFASLHKPLTISTGDLYLDKLKPESKEGKLLCDLEDIHGLECLVKEPTSHGPQSNTT